MSAVTPRTQTQGLPANGVTTGAVQITGTALRISARQTSGNVPANLALIRMNPGTGNWYRVTDADGNPREFRVPGVGDANQGNADINVTLPAEGASEYYHLLCDSPSAFAGTAEIESISAPAAAGGTVPQGRTLTAGAGLTGGGDLSSDRSFALGGTADTTWSTGAQTWAGAAGKAGSLIAGTGAALTIGAHGVAVASIDSAGLGLVLAANKNLSGAAGTGSVDWSSLTGTWKGPTGISTFNGKLAAAATAFHITDPGTGVAIPVTTSGSVPLVIGSAGAETSTLAIPTFLGQELDIFVDTIGTGTRAITASQAINQAGNTIMTFAQLRDYIRLKAISIGGALRWQVASNDGVVLS